MKPAIYTNPDDSRLAWLVDEHSATALIEKTTGRHLRHFETAVAIQNLRPGEFRFRPETMLEGSLALGLDDKPQKGTPEIIEGWKAGTFAPWPAVYATINLHPVGKFKKAYCDPYGPETCQGIHLRAAVVMLRLAASFQNVTSDRLTESFTFGKPRIEVRAPYIPWDEWAFLTAWLWSDWQARSRRAKLTLAARFEEIKAMGYPHGVKAFENMHRRLFPKPTH